MAIVQFWLRRWFPDKTSINFLRYKTFFVTLSCIASLMTLIGLYVRPLNFGIDFKGGLLFEVRFTQEADLGKVRKTLTQLNVGEIILQHVGDDKRDIMIKIGAKQGTPQEYTQSISKSLEESRVVKSKERTQPYVTETEARRLTNQEFERQRVYITLIKDTISSKIDSQADFRKLEYIGAEVGRETASKAVLALLLTLFGIQIYIWCRFSLGYAIGIVIGLIHDLILTLGFLVIMQCEFNSTSIAALLTVLGFSVNDTVVIYDRIRTNIKKRGKLQPEEVINQSINETILRTMFTGITTLLATGALIIFGGEALYTFSLTVFVGIIIGTYSSVFISVPYLNFFLNQSK